MGQTVIFAELSGNDKQGRGRIWGLEKIHKLKAVAKNNNYAIVKVAIDLAQ
jgi:hypothetical protein